MIDDWTRIAINLDAGWKVTCEKKRTNIVTTYTPPEVLQEAAGTDVPGCQKPKRRDIVRSEKNVLQYELHAAAVQSHQDGHEISLENDGDEDDNGDEELQSVVSSVTLTETRRQLYHLRRVSTTLAGQPARDHIATALASVEMKAKSRASSDTFYCNLRWKAHENRDFAIMT